jgi:hypothetical protein
MSVERKAYWLPKSEQLPPTVGACNVKLPINNLSPTKARSIADAITASPGTFVLCRQAAYRITFFDLANMLSHFHMPCFASGLWLASPTAYPFLADATDLSKNAVSSRCASSSLILLGLPVLVSDLLAPLGERGDLLLIDGGYLLAGDRSEIERAETVTLADETTVVAHFVMLN